MDDKDITDRLIQVGMIINTEVLDHLIISTRSYMSFVNTGLFDELKKSRKYILADVLEERVKKEATEIAKRNEKIEIAKAMKRSNEPVEKIAEFTGLPIEEIKKI